MPVDVPLGTSVRRHELLHARIDRDDVRRFVRCHENEQLRAASELRLRLRSGLLRRLVLLAGARLHERSRVRFGNEQLRPERLVRQLLRRVPERRQLPVGVLPMLLHANPVGQLFDAAGAADLPAALTLPAAPKQKTRRNRLALPHSASSC